MSAWNPIETAPINTLVLVYFSKEQAAHAQEYEIAQLTKHLYRNQQDRWEEGFVWKSSRSGWLPEPQFWAYIPSLPPGVL